MGEYSNGLCHLSLCGVPPDAGCCWQQGMFGIATRVVSMSTLVFLFPLLKKRYGDGAYPAGLNLTCDRIRRFCPTFPVDLGARACAPTGLLVAFHHHTVDAVRRFPLAGGADLVVVDPRIPGVDKRTRLSNRDFLARLGVLGRDDWPAV